MPSRQTSTQKPAVPAPPLLLTPAQVAHALHLHVNTLYAWLAAGKIPAVNIGSPERPTLRVRYTDLLNFLAECDLHASRR